MTFKESINVCLSKYADFDGRARRSEYIYFSIFTSLVSTVLIILFGGESGNGLLSTLWSLATVLPATAVSIRRLHDTNHKWTWYLGLIVPLFNLYIIYLLLFKAGDAGENRFGPDPKASVSASDAEFAPMNDNSDEAQPCDEEVTAEEPKPVEPQDSAEPDTIPQDEPDIIQQVVHAEYHPTEEIKLDIEAPVSPEFPNPLDDSPICPGCGARVKKTDKFCALCGTKL